MNNILFVCLGNICRSPLAEGFFRYHCRLRGLDDQFNIASAGTGDWHIGRPPDTRAIRVAAENHIDISAQTAMQIKNSDFQNFNWIIAMDRNNLAELESLAASRPASARIVLLSNQINSVDFIDVPDPWYGDYEDFRKVAGLLDQACAKLLDAILEYD